MVCFFIIWLIDLLGKILRAVNANELLNYEHAHDVLLINYNFHNLLIKLKMFSPPGKWMIDFRELGQCDY